MATVTSEVTIDTNEWEYVGVDGVGHKVTNGQTFNLTIDDNGAADVRYRILPNQSITTTDGYTITFRPSQVTDGQNTQVPGTSTSFTDAAQGTLNHLVSWTVPMSLSDTGIIQMWKVAPMQVSDADFGAAGTWDNTTFTDQFNNTMSFTGVTVAQAA